MKMALGLLFMSGSMAVMLGAGSRMKTAQHRHRLDQSLAGRHCGREDGTLAHKAGSATEPFHAGRIRLDKAQNKIVMAGVLPDNERDHLVERTAPAAFLAQKSE